MSPPFPNEKNSLPFSIAPSQDAAILLYYPVVGAIHKNDLKSPPCAVSSPPTLRYKKTQTFTTPSYAAIKPVTNLFIFSTRKNSGAIPVNKTRSSVLPGLMTAHKDHDKEGYYMFLSWISNKQGWRKEKSVAVVVDCVKSNPNLYTKGVQPLSFPGTHWKKTS